MKKAKKIMASMFAFYTVISTKVFGINATINEMFNPIECLEVNPNQEFINLYNVLFYIAVLILLLNGFLIAYKRKKKQKIGKGIIIILILDIAIIIGAIIMNFLL